MDGGAYCTLSPVVLSRGTLHAGGPYACPNVRIRVAGGGHQHAAQRRVPRLRRAADRVRRRDAGQPDRRGARRSRRSSSAGAGVYRPGDTTPTGQVLRESVAAEEVLERAAEAAEFERVRGARTAGRARRRARRSGARADLAHGIGLALAWHGAGFTGSGEVHLASVASVELTADGRIVDPDRLDRDRPGHADDLPAARRRRARRADRRGRARAAGHAARPRQRPDGRLAHGDGRRRAADRRLPRGSGRVVEERSGASVRRVVPRPTPGPTARPGSTSTSSRIPGVEFDDTTYRGDAYPAFGWAVGGRRGRGRPRHRRGRRPRASWRPTTSAG